MADTKKKNIEHWVKVCPKCGSKDVTDRGMISTKAYSNVNFCKSCGFQGPLFPEVSQEEAKNIKWSKPKFNPSQAPVMPQQRFTIKNRGFLAGGLIIAILLLFLLLLFG